MPGQWLDDPTGRYRKRWHDGTVWTDFVTDDGPASKDPLGAPPSAPPSQPAWSAVPFESDVPPPPPPQYPFAGPSLYGTYPGGPSAYPPQKGTNGFAVASLVLGIVWCYFIGSILAVIFGHVAISQIGRDGGQGKGLAIAGLVLGYIGIAAAVLVGINLAAMD